ncbi:MAG: hypothetical protein J6C49_02165 [Elusimicrobiaceae bacterium]|nr:hypothetical protein [Elusimicrobiaceae bacterium]
MTDKEQRILITKVSSNCHAQRICCDPFDDKEGLFCAKHGQYVRITEKDCAKCKNPVLAGISRAEAVKVMKPAVKAALNKAMAWNRSWEDTAQGAAEAALDALLGGAK